MNQKLISYYINNLSITDAIRIAKAYGGDFSFSEASIIVPFIKTHLKDLKIENKDYLLNELKKVVPNTTFQKVEEMVNRLLK